MKQVIEKEGKVYDFQKFKTVRSFGREVYNDNLALDDAFDEQVTLKDKIDKFKEFMKPQINENRELTFLKTQIDILREEKKFLMSMKVG